ncbi:Asp-tRNA(Asn)/Glu-tRNA(Gln) amidotransferase subunit GatC [Atopobacter phocae]|uniref:Asp-tRNA(Asn)/Glu-tRNA(Gln) amidotransferase subunit GatC n=1 Tax=Atopobacter phocae TaxID=136492 RepID=UPI000472D9C2|nr:Asp-tRNA(Asn)/Glu-tRNA(Gln) amidotransferase subunit GatC [Atopobacter phocae]
MKLTKEEVKQVAYLAKLSISEEEVEQITNEMQAIVDMAEQLDQLDIPSDVPLTTHGQPLKNAYREDVVKQIDERDELLKNVKTHHDGMIQVPEIMADGGQGA